MIDYRHITISDQQPYGQLLAQAPKRGCEYSFANLYVWGRQRMAFLEGGVTVFSQFDRRSVYLFPLGGDLKAILDRIIHDAHTRDIPCRLTGLTKVDCQRVERLYPGKFRFHNDRNGYDYLYEVNQLRDLSGRKFQQKRNHVNRFFRRYPLASVVPITDKNTPQVWEMVEAWFAQRLTQDPTRDVHMERSAIQKALQHRQALGLIGLALVVEGKVVAMTLGSHLSADTVDVHFEKALEDFDGAYAVINQAFAQHISQEFPRVAYLDREEDMGIEGLRKAKLSYEPVELREKYWACLLEDGYDY